MTSRKPQDAHPQLSSSCPGGLSVGAPDAQPEFAVLAAAFDAYGAQSVPLRDPPCRQATAERVQHARALRQFPNKQRGNFVRERRRVSVHVLAANHLDDRALAQHAACEPISYGALLQFASRLAEYKDVFPAVERSLIVGREVTSVEAALALDVALVPDDVADDFEARPSKGVDAQRRQQDALFAHRREDDGVLIVEVIEHVVEVRAARLQRAKDLLPDDVHVVHVTVEVGPLRVLARVVVRRRRDSPVERICRQATQHLGGVAKQHCQLVVAEVFRTCRHDFALCQVAGEERADPEPRRLRPSRKLTAYDSTPEWQGLKQGSIERVHRIAVHGVVPDEHVHEVGFIDAVDYIA